MHPVFTYDPITRVLTVMSTTNAFYLGQHSFIFKGINALTTTIVAQFNLGIKILKPIV